MGKHKLSNDTKKMLREVSKVLPKYYEFYQQKKIIHHKDIETNNFAPKEGINQLSTYLANYKDGKMLVDAKLHYKRMCRAWGKQGKDGYWKYLIDMNKKKFRQVNWYDRLLSKFNLN